MRTPRKSRPKKKNGKSELVLEGKCTGLKRNSIGRVRFLSQSCSVQSESVAIPTRPHSVLHNLKSIQTKKIPSSGDVSIECPRSTTDNQTSVRNSELKPEILGYTKPKNVDTGLAESHLLPRAWNVRKTKSHLLARGLGMQRRMECLKKDKTLEPKGKEMP